MVLASTTVAMNVPLMATQLSEPLTPANVTMGRELILNPCPVIVSDAGDAFVIADTDWVVSSPDAFV
jgi:hypothetical protein